MRRPVPAVARLPFGASTVLMLPMTTTRTGGFPIGFRRGRSEWQNDLGGLATWAAQNGFAAMDLGRFAPDDLGVLARNGLRLGSVDLLEIGRLTVADEGLRKELIARNVAYVTEAAAAGATTFFTVVPGDGNRPRAENYRLAAESFTPIAQAAHDAGASLAIEGYPGGPPHYALLCCTPETCRSFIKDVGLPSVGLNYDPSHLIRLGVDPVRFLREFLPHVRHVHAKDTELFPEAVYEYGLFQDSPFRKSHGYGALTWRYTIPGHGVMRWTEAFAILKEAGYPGLVSVELEDEHFNGTTAGEQAGLLHALNFLRGA